MKSIGVIGGGVLGKAVARGFMEHAEIRVYDSLPERATHTLAEAATADIVMICLPTPARPDGTCDTNAITNFLAQAEAEGWWDGSSCYVIRSTVRVGFTKRQAEVSKFKLPIFHSPEFLTARCSLVDFQTPSRNIIGNPVILPWVEEDGMLAWDVAQGDDWKQALREIEDLYRERFPGVPLMIMPSNASELVKIGCNSLFALKVTAFNLLAEVANAAGVEWEEVLGGIMADGRIAHAHTAVPGPDRKPGFGGTCLPKDTASLYHCATDLGVDAELLRAALARNEAQRRPHDPALAAIALPPPRTGLAAT